MSEHRHVTVARMAIPAGISREQVIEAATKRIRRDEGYLAYRKASGMHTSYDELVTADMRALALAARWLEDETTPRTTSNAQLLRSRRPCQGEE